MAGYDGGVTALCTLALLNSGVGVDDPVVRKALTYLRGLELDKTYTVSLQTMVLCAAEPKKDMLLIGRNVRWLERHQIKEGRRKGAWSYPGPGGDNSNAQFAVLALYDAQRVGVEVSRETWELAADYWRRTQNDDGSWGYVPGDAGTGSMTCAGIGGLAISPAALESGDAAVEDGRVDLLPAARGRRQAGARRSTGSAERFSVDAQSAPGRRRAVVPLLLSLRPGARRPAHRPPLHRRARLVSRRRRVPRPRAGFALALLARAAGTPSATRTSARRWRCCFLSKGRRPIVMAKLKYGDGDDWNQHRRDAANLTAYTEEAWELGLTWQVMDPADGHGRRPAASAGAVHQRQPGAGLAAARQEAARLRRPRRLHLRRSLLQRRQRGSTRAFAS